ncbi:hypothetical protein Tco_0925827 [Tanacetum coccineum]|uniref:Uncharacterized protein n=1 Tax=Tanacetum coccineum TaxID=301880 RepID=A0ABQ5D8U4_9ASTR
MDYAAEGQLRKMNAEKAWDTIEELARYEDEGWNNPVIPEEGSLDYENPDLKQLLGVMECKVGTLMEKEISLMGRSESIFGMSNNMMRQMPPEPSRQEAFEDLVMNFILDQEERVKQLEKYMGVIGSDFMQLSMEVIRKLKGEIEAEENRIKNIEKITRYPGIEGPEPLNDRKFSESLANKAFPHAPKSIPTSSLCVRYVQSIFPNPPLLRKSTFGFNPGKKGSQSVRCRHDADDSLTNQPTSHKCPTFRDDNPIESKTRPYYPFTLNIATKYLIPEDAKIFLKHVKD